MKYFWMLGFLLLSPQTEAYKFLCNGIDAEGNIESDTCGSCTDANASRWPNHTLSYSTVTTQVPSSISNWTSLVQSCMNSWTGVSGSSLTATFSALGTRNFGTNTASHDIFWVNDASEWMGHVGAGPEGILGVTLPPYLCSDQTTSFRVINDGDMILNAVPSAEFDWKSECTQLSDDCQSVRATVTHEMGHFLGLGHPCVDCASAVMAAKAAFLVQYPLFDDQEGFRALYPGTPSGAVATTCSSHTDCASGLQCHTQGSSQYCSRSCTEESDCPETYLTCGSTSKMCEFLSGAAVGAVTVYGDCSQGPCDDGLICVNLDDTTTPTAHCFIDCTSSGICQEKHTCHQLKNFNKELIDLKSCIQFATPENQACDHISTTQPVICPSEYNCVFWQCVSKANGTSLVEAGGSSGGSSSNGSCASAGVPTEFAWLALGLLILVPTRRKRCYKAYRNASGD